MPPLLRPVARTLPVTQRFGENPKDYPNSPVGHMGVDFGAPLETPASASLGGTIEFAGLDPETASNPGCGYGNYVMILHNNGDRTIYAHLGSISVRVGERVQMGQNIGLTGNSGRSDGPHLHWEWRQGGKQPTDPMPYMVDSMGAAQAKFQVVLLTNLNVRTGPDNARSIRYEAKKGAVMYAFDFRPDPDDPQTVYVQVGDGWIAQWYRGDGPYLELLPVVAAGADPEPKEEPDLLVEANRKLDILVKLFTAQTSPMT